MWFKETLSGGERETSQKKRMKELKRQSIDKSATVWVGKNGVTQGLLSQIKRQLEANEMIKVKVHKTSLEETQVPEIAGKIADETRSKVVDVRGRTFTIYKQRRTRQAQPK